MRLTASPMLLFLVAAVGLTILSIPSNNGQ